MPNLYLSKDADDSSCKRASVTGLIEPVWCPPGSILSAPNVNHSFHYFGAPAFENTFTALQDLSPPYHRASSLSSKGHSETSQQH